jgi:hypothetical protein
MDADLSVISFLDGDDNPRGQITGPIDGAWKPSLVTPILSP